MSQDMNHVKATANAHMRRDLAVGEWTCACADCHAFRSLLGMEKVLRVRPLVRDLQDVEDQMASLGEGDERSRLQTRFGELHDRLAKLMEE